MTILPPLSSELRRALETGFPPVRPLAPPARRVLAAAAWVPPAALVCVALLGFRGDAATLGTPLTWSVTAAEIALGLALSALALAAAIPGRSASAEAALGALAAAALALGGGAVLTRAASAGLSVPDPWLSLGPACFALSALFGLSALALIALLVSRTDPLRPGRALLLGGAGAGLMAEAVYRLHCAVTDLRHVLLWHGGALVAVALAGLGTGLLWERREGARMAARRAREMLPE